MLLRETPLDRFSAQILRVLGRPLAFFCTLLVFLLWLRLKDAGADLDLFARLAVGRLISESYRVPLTDPFSFTVQKSVWVDHEWLAGLIFYWVYSRFSDAGLVVLNVLFILATSIVLTAARRIYLGQRGHELLTILLFNVSIFGLWGATVRSLVFSYLGFAVTLFGILSYRSGRSSVWLWAIPIYMLLWVNTHAGFVMGLGLLAFFSVWHGRHLLVGRNQIVLVFLLSICATLINPYGARDFWNFIIPAVFKDRVNVPEWSAVALTSKEGVWALLWLAPIIIGILAKKRIVDPAGFLLLSVTAFQGFRSYRMMAFFYLTAFVYGSPYIETPLKRLQAGWNKAYTFVGRSMALFWALASVCFAVVALNFVVFSRSFRLDLAIYPVAAVDWLQKNHAGGKLLVHFDMGSYALWRLFPHFQVALDGRYEEVYPDETVELVMGALDPRSKNQAQMLAQLDPDYILSKKEHLEFSGPRPYPGFSMIYEDLKYQLFGKPQSE